MEKLTSEYHNILIKQRPITKLRLYTQKQWIRMNTKEFDEVKFIIEGGERENADQYFTHSFYRICKKEIKYKKKFVQSFKTKIHYQNKDPRGK